MRSFIIIPFLTSIAVAAPARLVSRQSVSDTETELENGPCRPITFIFARGSTELGNLVWVDQVSNSVYSILTVHRETVLALQPVLA